MIQQPRGASPRLPQEPGASAPRLICVVFLGTWFVNRGLSAPRLICVVFGAGWL